GGGFDSTTDRHNFAAALAGHDRPTEVLHIGDHDPSGVSMFLAFLEDVEAFTRELGGSAISATLSRSKPLPTSRSSWALARNACCSASSSISSRANVRRRN